MIAARLAFIAEWLDPNSGVLWRYQLFYYPATGEVEMFDIKNRRHFLKRVKYEGVTPQQLYVGSTVLIYSRQLRLVDYGDEATQLANEGRSERSLALIKPDAVRHMGKIINAIITSGFTIANLRMCQLTKSDAETFYATHSGKHFFQGLTSYMSSSPIVAIELMAANGISKWRQLLVKDGLTGLVLDCIQDVFQVTGLQMFNLDKAAAAEFLEVYKGVVAPGEFSGMVDELVAGPCFAVEVADKDGGGDPVEPFRQLCGPLDPELGRVLRPQSLRARFGISRVKNAVHCTDLPEDGHLETNYFFNILAQ
eukprot:gene6258-6496_t